MLGVYEPFSRRTKLAQLEGDPEPYQYENIPIEFRQQVVHLWKETIGEWRQPSIGSNSPPQNKIWKEIHNTMAKEYGLFELAQGKNSYKKIVNFFLSTTDVYEALDIVEFTFQFCHPVHLRKLGLLRKFNHLAVIEELNYRFRQWSIGFQFANGVIIRNDSEFIHKEVVVKAIKLLQDENFKGSCDEFLNGHSHYRDGKYKEASNEALKAFESALKTICKKKGWSYSDGDTSKRLLEVLFQNELIPNYLQAHFGALRSTLESGLPTKRNKTSAHGQGESSVEIPRYFANYCLNLAATNIVFLVDAYKESIKSH